MKGKQKAVPFLLALILFVSIIGGTAMAASIDSRYPVASGHGYEEGVSNEDKSLMILKITNVGEMKKPEVRNEAYTKANGIALQMKMLGFLDYFGKNPDEFDKRITTQVQDLEAFGFFGYDMYGPNACNMVRFWFFAGQKA